MKGIACCVLVGLYAAPLLHGQLAEDFTNDKTAIVKETGVQKVGYFLEGEFKRYFTGCTGGKPMKRHDNKTATSVPQALLQAGVPVFHWVRKPRTYSLARGFASVVQTTDLLTADLPEDHVDDADVLPLNLLQDPSSMVSQGESAIAYSANCTAILAGALAVDSNLKFVWVNLSTALKTDYTNSEKGELGVVQGKFSSPFLSLNDAGTDGATFGHFLLWEWYRKRYAGKTTIPAESLAVLSWVNGYALYWVNKKSRALDAKIDIKGSASYLGLVSGTGKLSRDYSDYGFTNVQSFQFAMLDSNDPQNGGATYGFSKLDSPAIVAGWLEKNAVFTTTSPRTVLSKGKTISQFQQMVGMPDSLCNDKLWQPTPAKIDSLGSLAMTGHDSKIKDGGLPTCSLEVTFTPSDSLFADGIPRNVLVDYKLTTSVANQSAALPAQRVTYQTSTLPSLNNETAYPYAFEAKKVDSGTVLSWSASAQILEDSPLDYSVLPTYMGDLAFTGCKALSNSQPPVLSNPTINGHKVTFSISQFTQNDKDFDPKAIDNVACGITGTLQFQEKNGSFARISLPSNLLLSYPNPEGKGFLPGSLIKLEGTIVRP